MRRQFLDLAFVRLSLVHLEGLQEVRLLHHGCLFADVWTCCLRLGLKHRLGVGLNADLGTSRHRNRVRLDVIRGLLSKLVVATFLIVFGVFRFISSGLAAAGTAQSRLII